MGSNGSYMEFVFTVILVLLLALPSIAKCSDIVHGPLPYNNQSTLVFESKGNNVAFFFTSKQERKLVDLYEPEGGEAAIETVFYYRINKADNVIVLISWRQLHRAFNIDGKLYEIKAYKYENGNLTANAVISQDDNLTGFDGNNQGQVSAFKYKNAKEIKDYLIMKY